MGFILDRFTGQREVSRDDVIYDDFPDGLKIVEIVNGQEREIDQVILVGAFMPKDSFDFGGKQRVVKEFYPGSSEPNIQVLGPEENDVTIKGSLDEKMLKDESLEGAAQYFQELLDAMRIRGNLVKITLGEWKRYGFIEEAKFRLFRLSRIEYEITFIIAGFNPPQNYYLVEGSDGDLLAPKKELTNKVVLHLQMQSQIPSEMPHSLIDTINEVISGVASSVSMVTNFVDGILDDADKIQASAQRAIGLIRNARAFISQASRRIGSIDNSYSNLGSQFTSEYDKTRATIKNIEYLHSIQKSNKSLAVTLAEIQSKFASFIQSLPLRRHMVQSGDTLQKLSIKYFGSPDNWKKIMDHNKLTDPELVVGKVIEIPRV